MSLLISEERIINISLPYWKVSDRIVGYDKNSQINSWIVSKVPGVQNALYKYINEQWRPKYEHWETNGNGQLVLREGLLFPSSRYTVSVRKELKKNRCYLTSLVKKALLRAGIPVCRAHAHAFRKGVVTALLRTGNPLKTVSAFVHHKSTSTTEKSYDKRGYEELVSNMVLPLEWDALVHEAKEITIQVEQENDDGTNTSVTNSVDRERLEYINGMARAANNIENLKQKNKILRGLLTVDQLRIYHDTCLAASLDADTD